MKVLLLTDIQPSQLYSGGLFVAALCRLFPEDALACFCVLNPALDPGVPPGLEWLPLQVAPKPLESTMPATGMRRRDKLYNLAWETYVAQTQVPRLAAEAVEFGRRHGCDRVWCVLEGQTLIRLARRVAAGLGVPLHCQVFDPPEWWLRAHGVNRISARQVLDEFAAALRASRQIGAASWAMAEAYTARYGTAAVPLVPGLDASLASLPQTELPPGGDFVIAVAGQLYASEEWDALLDALHLCRWEIAGRRVRVWVFGPSVSLRTKAAVQVEYFGWRSQTETLALLTQAGVLYCPYFFDPAYDAVTRLSFPSKLVTYLASGRPVLFHGPDYASPYRFLAEQGAGLGCHSLAPAAVLAALEQLATDPALYARLARAGSAAFHRHLTTAHMQQALARFLDVDPGQLRQDAVPGDEPRPAPAAAQVLG